MIERNSTVYYFGALTQHTSTRKQPFCDVFAFHKYIVFWFHIPLEHKQLDFHQNEGKKNLFYVVNNWLIFTSQKLCMLSNAKYQ